MAVTLPLPPDSLTADFLRQIADSPRDGGVLSFTYAASIILPETGWAAAEFERRLRLDLDRPQNQRILGQAKKEQRDGSFLPFSFSLTAESGARSDFLALPRPESPGSPPVTAITAQSAPVGGSFSSNEEVFKLLELFPAYVLLIDKEYTVRFSNRAARQIFGQINGKKCHQALRDSVGPCLSCPPFGLLTDKAIKVHEWVNPRTNTAFRTHSYPFEDRNGVPLILQIGINITAGVRARHALDMSEQRYRSIAENLTMGLALVDPSLKIVTLNPRMVEWFGKNAVKGASIEDLLHFKCCAGQKDPGGCIFRTLLADRSNQETEFRLDLHTGEERFFRLVACPILTRSRQVRAVVIMLEDVTERRNMAARMQQMQRLEALGSLAGGIAHEINQPLSALHLYASGMQMLLEKGSTSPEQILERLALILAQADKIRQIISHMRALVMQEENPPRTAVLVSDAVADAMSLVGTQLRDHAITVALDVPESLPPVSVNAVQLEQVVINLLVNAMHALDALAATDEPREKHIAVTASPDGDGTLKLRVSDNGPGLGALHSRIFDPFFTTKDSHLGMGLGLSIVHAFVTSWGGTIEAGDNPGVPGATFTVTLPLAQDGDDEAGIPGTEK